MPTRISRDFEFLAAVYFEGNFIMNKYGVMLTMKVETSCIKEQNIAMDRIKYLIHQLLENAVFVQDSETKIIEKYQSAGLKVCTLPEEPYDQIVTMILLYKLNSICEGRLVVTDIQLDSVLSDDVGFLYDTEEIEVDHPYKQGWWIDPGPTITDKVHVNKKEKIVKLVKKCDWDTLDLDWEIREILPTEIIFAPETEK